jgi:hypothetical protein
VAWAAWADHGADNRRRAAGAAQLHFAPRYLQFVAMRSPVQGRLPTMRSLISRKDRNMFTINLRTRLTAAVLACVTSSLLLGSVVLSMAPWSASADIPVVALEHITIAANRVQ